jgi:5-methylcytosine-specific restriction endonuclease McrA
VPHPDAPTIDHLLPLCDGGDDVRANVQLAHFLCNSRRGAGGVVQLALVG